MGAIIGGLIIFYIIGKVIEWAVLKRVFDNYRIMFWASSLSVFAIIFTLWFFKRDKAYAFHPAMFIDYAIAGTILPIIRIIWRNRKEAKESRSER